MDEAIFLPSTVLKQFIILSLIKNKRIKHLIVGLGSAALDHEGAKLVIEHMSPFLLFFCRKLPRKTLK